MKIHLPNKLIKSCDNSYTISSQNNHVKISTIQPAYIKAIKSYHLRDYYSVITNIQNNKKDIIDTNTDNLLAFKKQVEDLQTKKTYLYKILYSNNVYKSIRFRYDETELHSSNNQISDTGLFLIIEKTYWLPITINVYPTFSSNQTEVFFTVELDSSLTTNIFGISGRIIKL